jgi:hypothetical protein
MSPLEANAPLDAGIPLKALARTDMHGCSTSNEKRLVDTG